MRVILLLNDEIQLCSGWRSERLFEKMTAKWTFFSLILIYSVIYLH